jgi:hypothetical protein
VAWCSSLDAELAETHEGFVHARARMEGKIDSLFLLISENATIGQTLRARDKEIAVLSLKVEEETARADQWYRDCRIEEQVGHHQADQIEALESEMQSLQGEKFQLSAKVENLVEQLAVDKAELAECQLLLSEESAKCDRAESSLVQEQQEGNAMQVYITELQAKLASTGHFEELKQRGAHMDEKLLELCRIVETGLVEVDRMKEQLQRAERHWKERLDELAKTVRCKIEERFCGDRERELHPRDELLTRSFCLYPAARPCSAERCLGAKVPPACCRLCPVCLIDRERERAERAEADLQTAHEMRRAVADKVTAQQVAQQSRIRILEDELERTKVCPPFMRRLASVARPCLSMSTMGLTVPC